MEKTSRWAPIPAGARIRGILTVCLLVLVAGYSWISTTQVAAQVLGGVDGTIETWFLTHQGDEFSIIMQVLVAVGHPLLALAALLFCVLLTRSGAVERPLLFAVYLSMCLLVATAVATVVTHLALPGSVASTVGLGLGSEAGQTLISTSLLTGSAWLIIRRYSAKWRRMVLTVTGLVAITPLIALSHVYLGEQEPSQLAVGWILGTLFAAASSASWPVSGTTGLPDRLNE